MKEIVSTSNNDLVTNSIGSISIFISISISFPFYLVGLVLPLTNATHMGERISSFEDNL